MANLPITLTPLGGTPVRVISVRLYQFWVGAWVAECELDPPAGPAATPAPTSGPATLSLGGLPLVGTVDPRGSGSFSSKASARIVAGAGGWDKLVPAQDFVSDLGVPAVNVWTATGTLVKEKVVVTLPVPPWGVNIPRSGGPARRVFDGVDWWVDFTGTTTVGPRLPAVTDPNLVITDWDPVQQLAHFSSDVPLLPNTTLIDPRFNGATPIVRDVEQLFDRTGSKGWAWCGAKSSTRLLSALQNLIIETGGRIFLRPTQYRVILYQGNRPALQAVNPIAGLPDLIPLAEWTGLAGLTATLAPGQVVLVGFDFTNTPPTPVILAFSPNGKPVKAGLDATVEVDIGASAPLVKLATGLDFLVKNVPYEAMLSALKTFASAVGTATTPAQIISAGAALSTSLLAISPAGTTIVKGT